MRSIKWQYILLFFVLVKIVFHLIINPSWPFHRDELLYLTLADHLDFGYASVPPGISFWAYICKYIFGDSVFAVRSISTLFGTATIVIMGLIARDLIKHIPFINSDGSFTMILVGLSGIVSGGFLRTSMLFQPVVFDIFYWTVILYLLLRYIHTNDTIFLSWVGIISGIALLNKYTVFILVAALLPGILLSDLRKMFIAKRFYLALAAGILIISPNIYWQYKHHFPVIKHITELASTQFVHVSLKSFFLDQLFFYLPVMPIWSIGLVYILFNKDNSRYRVFGIMYLTVLLILLLFKAKSYYTLGTYPFLIVFGSLWIEKYIYSKYKKISLAIIFFILLVALPLIPVFVPIIKPEKMVSYISKLIKVTGIKDMNRWENGKYYDLPQDYADMLGWQELGEKVGEIWQSIPNKVNASIFGDSYGHAAAISYFGKKYGIGEVMCFADAFEYWLPKNIDRSKYQTFIYLNDDLGEDMNGFFGVIEKKYKLDMPLSRQHGHEIYVCTQPTEAFFERIEQAITAAKSRKVILD